VSFHFTMIESSYYVCVCRAHAEFLYTEQKCNTSKRFVPLFSE